LKLNRHITILLVCSLPKFTIKKPPQTERQKNKKF
jgi:hypothetical protein